MGIEQLPSCKKKVYPNVGRHLPVRLAKKDDVAPRLLRHHFRRRYLVIVHGKERLYHVPFPYFEVFYVSIDDEHRLHNNSII